MNGPTGQRLQALARLADHPDFRVVLAWLGEEREAANTALMTAKDRVLVHQLQGETLCLTDLLRLATTAPALVR